MMKTGSVIILCLVSAFTVAQSLAEVKFRKSLPHSFSEQEWMNSQFSFNGKEICRLTFFEKDFAEHDSLTVFITSLGSGEEKKIKVHLPNLGVKLPEYPIATCLALNDEFLVISFKGFFSIFSRKEDRFQHLRDEPIAEFFTAMEIYGDTLMFSKCRNNPRISQQFKVSLVSYAIRQNKYLAFVLPSFNGIYLTHFTPYNYIATAKKKWALVDPLTYEIRIFSATGDLLVNYRKKSGWDTLAVLSAFRSFEKNPNDRNVRPYLDSVHKMLPGLNYVKQVYFVNDSLLLINYFEQNKLYSDVFSLKNNTLTVVREHLDAEVNESEKISINRYPPYFRFFDSYFYDNGFIQLRSFSPEVDEFGLKPKEYVKKLDKYFKDNESYYKIYYMEFR